MAVTKDAKYTICFDAKSTEEGIALGFVVDMGGKPDYSELSGWLSTTLSTSYKTITTTFTAKTTTDTARLAINMGKTLSGYSLDNIAVYAGEVSCPAAVSPVADVAAGKTKFDTSCAGCHATPNGNKASYSGGAGNPNQYSLEVYIANFMPKGNPGGCKGQCAVNVAAHLKAPQ